MQPEPLAPGRDACPLCRNEPGNKTIAAREMMFGYRDTFEYMECAGCGALSLKNVPEDLIRYYPQDYYPAPALGVRNVGLRKFLRHERARYCLHGRSPFGWMLTQLFGQPKADIFGQPQYYAWLRQCGVNFDSRILDVGCGSGILLQRLHEDGFTDLTGVDPFIAASLLHSPRLRILRDEVFNLTEQFDLIMLHHTFEHMPAPVAALRHFHRLLNEDGHVLIRIPIASSFSYRKYRGDWAQLDAPRHLYLHTLNSMRLVAEQSGFKIAKIVFDSTAFQFWASEQYLNNIPLKDARSYGVNPQDSIFSAEDIRRFEDDASELNRAGEGDSACFYLRKDKSFAAAQGGSNQR